MLVSKDHPVYEELRTKHNVEALPRLIAEWNMNRYVGAVIDNNPKEFDEAFEPEYFPIESLIKTNRPDKGIVKARVGEARAGHEFVNTSVQQFIRKKVDGNWTNIARVDKDGNNVFKTYTRPENSSRYYAPTPEDYYKYWTSPKESLIAGDGTGGYEFPTGFGVSVLIEYDQAVRTNKVSICAETTWCAPKTWDLYAGTDNGDGTYSWTKVADNGTENFKVNDAGAGLLGDDGRLEFYYNGTSWGTPSSNKTTARDLQTPVVKIDALRFRVFSITKPKSHLSMIEISPRMEKDLTPYLRSTSADFEMSEPSFLTPIGKASSNTGSLSLFNPLVADATPLAVDEEHSVTSNRGLLFNHENPHSLFYGLLDANVKFNLEYLYEVSGSTYSIPGLEMYSGNWSGQTQDEVSVNLIDYAKYMMEIKPEKAMYLNRSVAEIVWRICDGIGFTKYVVERLDTEFPRAIPIFWIDGTKTVWEIFAELTEQTQIAIYFDATGTLQIKTKESALDADRDGDSVWSAMGQKAGGTVDDADYDDGNYSGSIADIIDLDKNNEYSANHVTINYQTTEFTEYNNGFPIMETVWEPGSEIDDTSKEDKRGNGTFDDHSDNSNEGSTLVLRATPVRADLLKSDTFVKIDPDQAKHWPYEGIVQIQGEMIRYDGKQYVWYDNGNVRKTAIVNHADELKDIEDKSSKTAKHKNHFTGNLFITERGLWNTENKRHPVEAEGYNVHTWAGGTKSQNNKGFRHFRSESHVQLRLPRNMRSNVWRFANRGQSTDAGFYTMGTMMRFPKTCGKHAMAGITFHQNGSEDDGYFIELRPTSRMTASTRKTHNELSFYSKKGGNIKRFGGAKNKGVATFIAEETWYEIDFNIERVGGEHIITIWLNGQQALEATIASTSEWFQTWGGKFGMYVRGNTIAQWEYLYAISRPEKILLDDFSFMEKVNGAYVGRQWEREWVWRTRTDSRRTKRGWKKEQERFSQMFYDEFGPYAHEVREFSVNFDPNPVLHSRLYVSNDYEIVCPEYRSNAFGADFILANAARKNAIAHGGDPFLGGNSHSSLIFGRVATVQEAETVIVKDEDSIRKRGRTEVAISSPWIQSKGHALAIADWIKSHWGRPSDELTIELFGNPLIEITDVITVSYKLHDFNLSNHQYFVTSINHSFGEGGVSTRLVCRRAWKLT